VVELTFGWASRFRRLVKDHERLQTFLVGMHHVAFGLIMLQEATPYLPCM
jgi:transposase